MLRRVVGAVHIKSSERGFSFLELLAAMSIMAVLSLIAVPRFTNVTTLANTSKVQADLSVLNSAIALYQAEQSTPPTALTDLSPYVNDVNNLKPPKGKIFVRSEDGSADSTVDCPTAYTVVKDTTNDSVAVAKCGDYTINRLGRKDTTTTGGNG